MALHSLASRWISGFNVKIHKRPLDRSKEFNKKFHISRSNEATFIRCRDNLPVSTSPGLPYIRVNICIYECISEYMCIYQYISEYTCLCQWSANIRIYVHILRKIYQCILVYINAYISNISLHMSLYQYTNIHWYIFLNIYIYICIYYIYFLIYI